MDLMAFSAFCGSRAAALDGMAGGPMAIPLLLFFVGLTGSAVHCGPMCGPFVLAQVSDRLATVPAVRLCEATRLRSALLLPYHLGRLIAYAGLGAAAATFGTVLGRLPWLDHVSGILLLVASAFFVLIAAKRLIAVPGLPVSWFARLARQAGGIDRTTWRGGLLLGLLLGFLPCGLLYGALAVAGASPHIWSGALAMLGFGLGTVPGLVVVGLLGHLAGVRWHGAIAMLAPVIMLINAVMLAGIGWSRAGL